MKKLILCLAVILLFPCVAIGQARIRFIVEMATVQKMLKGGSGNWRLLLKLDKQSFTTIADFWWDRALEACKPSIYRVMRQYLDKRRGTSKEGVPLTKQEIEKNIYPKTRSCFQSYFYDHWDEINRMILVRYNVLKKSRAIKEPTAESEIPPPP